LAVRARYSFGPPAGDGKNFDWTPVILAGLIRRMATRVLS
jgi:hypothetical protein